MNRLFYPAIFQSEDTGYSISFPDLEGCLTQGNTVEESYEMAFDALGLTLSYLQDNHLDFPAPSEPRNISLQEGQFIVIIEFDMISYLKKHSSKSVKKTLTIPEWLNERAMAMNINFSQVLQEALMVKLQL